jgi:hypothetical protein
MNDHKPFPSSLFFLAWLGLFEGGVALLPLLSSSSHVMPSVSCCSTNATAHKVKSFSSEKISSDKINWFKKEINY